MLTSRTSVPRDECLGKRPSLVPKRAKEFTGHIISFLNLMGCVIAPFGTPSPSPQQCVGGNDHQQKIYQEATNESYVSPKYHSATPTQANSDHSRATEPLSNYSSGSGRISSSAVSSKFVFKKSNPPIDLDTCSIWSQAMSCGSVTTTASDSTVGQPSIYAQPLPLCKQARKNEGSNGGPQNRELLWARYAPLAKDHDEKRIEKISDVVVCQEDDNVSISTNDSASVASGTWSSASTQCAGNETSVYVVPGSRPRSFRQVKINPVASIVACNDMNYMAQRTMVAHAAARDMRLSANGTTLLMNDTFLGPSRRHEEMEMEPPIFARDMSHLPLYPCEEIDEEDAEAGCTINDQEGLTIKIETVKIY